MYVKFLKDYEKYQGNKIGKLPAFKAKKLIRDGVAERVDRAFRIDDLYVARLVGVKKMYFGEIADAVDLGYKVFSRYCDSCIFEHEDQFVYTHVLTGNDFKPDNTRYSYIDVVPGKMIVRSGSVRSFAEFFMDDLAINDLTIYDYVSDKDIKKAEIYLGNLSNIKQRTVDKNKTL